MRRSRAIEAAVLMMAAATLRAPALAQDIPPPAARSAASVEDLQLEVWINDRDTGLVASVTREADGRLLMTPDELRAVGLAAPRRMEPVDLAVLPGLRATYDEDGQRLMVEASGVGLMTQRFDLGPPGLDGLDARQDFGAVVNYALTADGGQNDKGQTPRLGGLGAAVEARLFGRFGTFESAFSGAYASGQTDLVRLDTTWNWYSPRHALNVRAGDFINAGFSWTRPIRMAGVQIRRDFGTRPDLITLPSPRLSASAAAPSILDLYVNDVPVLSRRVGAGPIEVDGLPPSQGFSQARLVLRDETGRQTTVTAPFFTTPLLLRRGFVDYAAEAGVARRYFGVRSNDYADMPLATGSVRYGLRDGLTLEGHAEAGAGLVNVGGGVATQLNGLGVAAVSVATSHNKWHDGTLAAAVFDSRFAGIYISAMALQASSGYRDIAAATSGKWAWRNGKLVGDLPSRSVRQLTLSAPLNLTVWRRGDEPATLSVGYAAQETQDRVKRTVWNGSLRQTLDRRITLYATGYVTRGDRRDVGAFFGVAIPLGATTSATVGAETQGGDTIGFVEASKAEDQSEGSTAWRARVDQGANSRIEGQAVYRGRAYRVSGAAQYVDGATRGQVQLDGAVAWLGGRPALANRLDSAFALVDVGAPGVPVLFQNQMIGHSGRDGRLVVRNLAPFDQNKIAIDPQNLALDLEAADTEKQVAPIDGGGVRVRFGVAKTPPSALVTLRLANGEVVPPGAEVTRAGSVDRVIVGYDGQTFLTNLTPANDLTVHLEDDATCVAHFAFTPSATGGPGVVEAICR
ncbi:fimbria/pilus outer membrane usher protein [Caulobacter soli]|uniref:fimbria/pilus outer membrane usher protein n=1 Tax=Caulobacter soli TaxID=2708539 RepID=UPI0013EADF29|nr:fimbria/pilus outer membrane usher protein [Caulobacter soli]